MSLSHGWDPSAAGYQFLGVYHLLAGLPFLSSAVVRRDNTNRLAVKSGGWKVCISRKSA